MVFGEIKTIIEQNFINSYTNKSLFTETVVGFKKNFLRDKSLAKMYLLYGQLTTPMGLNEQDAKDFMEEAISQLKSLKNKIKLPKSTVVVENEYQHIDEIIYNESVDISKILKSKKAILNKLTEKPKVLEAKINLPISSMVKIANKTIKEHIETMDEETKNDLLGLVSESLVLEDFESEKKLVLEKLNDLVVENNDPELNEKIKTTIEKIENDEPTKINYYKLKKLKETL